MSLKRQLRLDFNAAGYREPIRCLCVDCGRIIRPGPLLDGMAAWSLCRDCKPRHGPDGPRRPPRGA